MQRQKYYGFNCSCYNIASRARSLLPLLSKELLLLGLQVCSKKKPNYPRPYIGWWSFAAVGRSRRTFGANVRRLRFAAVAHGGRPRRTTSADVPPRTSAAIVRPPQLMIWIVLGSVLVPSPAIILKLTRLF